VQLFAAGALGQRGDDFTRRLNANVRYQQLLFQLLEQIIIDFFAAEKSDKSGTEILFRFQQAAFQACKETLFGRLLLLQRSNLNRRLLKGDLLLRRRRERGGFQLLVGEFTRIVFG